MPTSAVSRPRNTSTAAAAASRAATALPSSTRLTRQQRAGPSSASAGVVDDWTGAGRQEDAARSSRTAGVERSLLGRVLHQQVRADIHSDQSSRLSSTTAQQQGQPPASRSSRSTPATDARRTGLPRSSGVDAAKSRSRSTVTDAGRQAAASFVADSEKTSLPRLSASSSTSNAEKSEEELEKMRILARHIKVCIQSALCR